MVHKQRPAAREDVAGGLDHATERCCTFAHRWHTVGRQLARANSGFGARQLVSWRAPSPELARAKWQVGAPTSHLARANSPVGARQIRIWRANLPLGAPGQGEVNTGGVNSPNQVGLPAWSHLPKRAASRGSRRGGSWGKDSASGEVRV